MPVATPEPYGPGQRASSAAAAPRPGEPGATDLPQVAVRAVLLAYAAFAASKIIAFASTIALTRLLDPQQFGLVGYGLAVLQYLDVVTTAGATGAVIAARQRVQETTNSAFATSVATGLLLYAVVWFAAPALAGFFNAPALVAVLRLLALVVPLAGLGAVPNAVLQRALDFRARLVVDVGSSLVKAAVAVALAFRGLGAWSLVAGQLAGETTATLLAWWLAGWRPGGAWDRVAHRQALAVSGHLVSVGLAGAVVSNADYLIVGRALGAAALGYYTLAYRVPELLLTNLNWVVGRVSFPVLVSADAQGQALRRFYFAYVRYVTLVAFPIGVGLAVVAEPFVVALFSANWLPSARVMRLVALALALSTISHVPGSIYKATGRAGLLNRLALVKLPVTIGCLIYGARWGIGGVAGAQCVLAVFHLVLDSAVIARVAGIAPRVTLGAALPAAAASAVMAAGLVGGGAVVHLPGWRAIGAAICVGGALYVAVLAALWPAVVREVRASLTSALGGVQPAVPLEPSRVS